jgi:hypothetical protein
MKLKQKNMKRQAIILASLALVAVSCNSGGEKKENKTSKAEATDKFYRGVYGTC